MTTPDSIRSARASEWLLVAVFVGLIAAVPISQTWLELRQGQRAQFTDVFRARPTARALREFERALESRSWVRQWAQPRTQRWLYRLLGDTGAKALPGQNGWLFYRPDVRYLVEPDRIEPAAGGRWAPAGVHPTQRAAVVAAVVRFRDQLRQRGIELLVVPVPGKPAVYPDELTRRARGAWAEVESPTAVALAELGQAGVVTVDLFRVFREARRGEPERALYLRTDTHWTPHGAELAARAVAEALRARGWAPARDREFRVEAVPVRRWGDVAGMIQAPGLAAEFGSEDVGCTRVHDALTGLLVPGAADRPGTFRAAGGQAKVLLLGDSFSRVYQYLEPRSLGEVRHGVPDRERQSDGAVGIEGRLLTRALLPGSAGFPAHLARELAAAVDTIVSDGGAATEVRQRLSVNPEILEGKRVVIWEFVERELASGAAGWEDVSLPRRLEAKP